MSEDRIGIPLGEIGVWRGGGTPSKSNPSYWTGSIPWVSPKDMKATEIVDSIDHISSEAISESATQVIPAESIVMVTRSGILDHSFPVAITKRDVTINQDLKAVTLHNGIEPRYAMLALKAFGRSILDDCAKEGTTVASVDFDRLKSFEIPLSPLPEQRRIVAKLDALQSRTRIAREALDAVAPLLKSFRQSVLQAAVTGALTEEWRSKQTPASEILNYPESASPDSPVSIPECWKWVSLKDLSSRISDGVHKKPQYVPQGIPFVTVKNLTAGRGIDFSQTNFVTTEDHAEFCKRTHPERGDLLLSKDGTLGVVRLIETDEVFSIFVSVALIKPHDRRLSRYLCIALESPVLQGQMVGVGTGLQHIHLCDLREDVVPLPPLAEQTEIVRRVQHLFAMADAMEAEFAAAQRSVDQLDQSLLATAFRGELVPQDPSDEPASVLLERIRAARAALPETKSKRGRKPSSDFDASLLMAAEPALPKKRGRPAK